MMIGLRLELEILTLFPLKVTKQGPSEKAF